ncbi:GNAT family N-acetyltransferase [Kribbella sp. NPDC051620]|uniref:GNAT family N-acetyltransferase n=1 Tax=Kribbella sp. NPDC051620 TaxID=3364120 RepID=UPI0037A99A23
MAELVLDRWPVEELGTERLVLREARELDRDGLVGLLSSVEAYRYLGGAMSREQAEAAVRAPYGLTHGSFVVREVASGEFVGAVSLKRRDDDWPGAMGRALDIGYLLLPEHWGKGYAQEAVGAVLRWLPTVVPDEKVVAGTQSANVASLRLLEKLGFVEVERFEEFGAEQVLCAAELPR